MASWHENTDFWEQIAPLLFDSHRLEDTPIEVEQALGLMQLAPGAAILDQACGIGRHARELARLGFQVTGLDRTSGLLDQARSTAASDKLEIEWIEADMREFSRPETFDGALNFFSSFGYFEDPTDDERVARNLFESLRPGGVALIDTMGREVIARDFVERDWRKIGDLLLIEERSVEQDWNWMKNEWTVVRDDETSDYTWGIRLYSGTELRRLFMDQGFETVELYGNLDGAPYDPDADRLIAVARKRS